MNFPWIVLSVFPLAHPVSLVSFLAVLYIPEPLSLSFIPVTNFLHIQELLLHLSHKLFLYSSFSSQ